MISKWPISSQKSVQHNFLSGKCKLQTQWHISTYLTEGLTLKSLTVPSVSKEKCRATWTLIYCRWDCKLVQPHWKTLWQCLLKLNICLLYDLTMLFYFMCQFGWAMVPKQLAEHYSGCFCEGVFVWD